MSRAALYMRVSTDRQARDDRWSLPEQRGAFARRCQERGYTPAGEYQDTQSGARVTRSGYQRMLADARSGAFEVIVVTFLDRFGRNERESITRVWELESLGITVDAVHDDISHFVTLAFTAYAAAEERRKIAERTRLTQHAAVRGGRYMGRPPYGYRPDGTTLAIDERSAAVVRRIFRLYVEGSGLLAIARRLNREGVPAPSRREWTNIAVGKVLRRRTYAGTIAWGEASRDGAVPAIIDRETFERVQQIRATRASTNPRSLASPYMLTGLLECGSCGGRVNGTTLRHEGGRWVYRVYTCTSRRRGTLCPRPVRVPTATLEQEVIDALRHMKDVEPTRSDGRSELEERLAGIERDLAATSARFDANMRLFYSGVLADEDQLRAANALVAQERARLEAERDEVQRQAGRLRRVIEPARVQSLIDAMQSADPRTAGAALRETFERIVVSPEGSPVIHL